jgi:hypothetical protein
MKVWVKFWSVRNVSWNFLGGGSSHFPLDPIAGSLAGKTEQVFSKLAMCLYARKSLKIMLPVPGIAV